MRRGRRLAPVLVCALACAGTAAAATPVLGPARTTLPGAQEWARAHRGTPRFVELAGLYWRLAPRRGVRPEVAYAQAAVETGFGRFGGVLDPSFRNPCGLKRRRGGPSSSPRAHERFRSWREGVSAHLDHLALYAAAPGYPRGRTEDPRHFRALLGRARTVQALGGKWAPSPGYGRGVARLVRSLVRTAPPATPAPPDRAAAWPELRKRRLEAAHPFRAGVADG